MIFRRTLLIATTVVAAAAAMTASADARPRTSAKPPRTPLHLAPAHEQLAALRRGDITSRALLQQYLDHHDKVNPGIGAVVTLDAEAARAADRADQHLARTGKPLGPLHGLPMTVKDALETKGLRTTCGSPDLADHVPARDADAVALLRAAGAVVFGKTNVPVMCQDIQTSNPLFGTTKNPFADDRTAGGSSGGPAAAVAAGLSALEVGSDLAGSLRLPAAYCGVYALRTSRGASPVVPTRGHIPRPRTGPPAATCSPWVRSPVRPRTSTSSWTCSPHRPRPTAPPGGSTSRPRRRPAWASTASASGPMTPTATWTPTPARCSAG